MRNLDRESYEKMVEGATVMARDEYGDKVLKLGDGSIIKLFRLKRILSSALIWPYAKRFERGARRLRELNLRSVEVIKTFRLKSMGRHAVVYKPLEGEPLRDSLRHRENHHKLLAGFAAFFSTLHDRGVYFRGIHFGNVIVLTNGEFGLIDVSEVHVSSSSLNISKRVRNFKPVFRYAEDREAILEFGLETFLEIYLENSNLSPNSGQAFLHRFRRHPEFYKAS